MAEPRDREVPRASVTDSLKALDPARLLTLSRLLEAFTATPDLDEVLRRVVNVTLAAFDADRAFMLRPLNPGAKVAQFTFEATKPGFEGALARGISVPVEGSGRLLERALESSRPIAISRDDSDVPKAMRELFDIGSQLLQVLTTRDGSLWCFGLQQCHHDRRWREDEIDFFQEIGRYATLAINNAQLQKQSLIDAFRIETILDHIPEAAALYNETAVCQVMNAVAKREAPFLSLELDKRRREYNYRTVDGKPVSLAEMPLTLALKGQLIRGDYLLDDPRVGNDRVFNIRSSTISDPNGTVTGAILLVRDVTDERKKAEHALHRKERAEFLAAISTELVVQYTAHDDLSAAAERIGEFGGWNVAIYIYDSQTDHLKLTGSNYGLSEPTAAFRNYILQNPYHSGEGLPGAVFQIHTPLVFAEIKGEAVTEFGRTQVEKAKIADLMEQSLAGLPIDAYGKQIGALVVSSTDALRPFGEDDKEFLECVAEKIGIAAHIRNLNQITAEGQKAAEELARREVDARARFEAVLESAPVGIAVISADELRFEMANPLWVGFAQRLGRISAETSLLGMRVSDVVPDFEKDLELVADTGEAQINEAVPVRDGDRVSYFNTIVSAVQGRLSGTTQSLTLLVQDVTEQVRAKREFEVLAQLMEERSARLESVLSSMTDGLWLYNTAGQVIDVNQAALDLFGLGSRSEAIERGSFQDFDLRYPDGKAIPVADMPLARALRGEVVPDYLAFGRHLLTRNDIDLSIAIAPIENNGIVGAVIVIRDITALQELDRKKDEFLSVASHELRTPLTTIKGYSQLLAQTVNDLEPKERATYLNAVLGEIERMMGLISELLDVSRIETNRLQVNPQDIEWIGFLQRQSDAFRVQNPKRIIELSSSLPEITLSADPDRIRQVVDNLISNALKYSPDGSKIEVRVSMSDDQVITSFVDRGIGIPRDEVPQLFERFHRARNVSSRYYGGLGLGLYIARAIVEVHGGTIQVESEEGVGSTFSIALPISSPSSQS